MEGIIQYYNHIDTIQATSFVEKCRILAHANALFHGEETKAQFKEEQGNWTDFLNKIGQTRPQVSRLFLLECIWTNNLRQGDSRRF